MNKLRFSFLLVCFLLVAGPSFAGPGPLPEDSGPLLTSPSESAWQTRLGLYGWAAGLDGTIGAAGFTTDTDISFSDIFDTLDMTVMGALEFHNGPWMFQLEGLYLKNSVGVSAISPRGFALNAKLVAETTRVEPVFGYRVLSNESTDLDLLAGMVYYDISNKLRLSGPRRGRTVSSGDSWWDPMIGVRVHHAFSEKWSVVGRSDIGGFGVNADLAWQLSGFLQYGITENLSAFGGYRHAAVDYQNGNFVYDVAASGPILGLVFQW